MGQGGQKADRYVCVLYALCRLGIFNRGNGAAVPSPCTAFPPFMPACCALAALTHHCTLAGAWAKKASRVSTRLAKLCSEGSMQNTRMSPWLVLRAGLTCGVGVGANA